MRRRLAAFVLLFAAGIAASASHAPACAQDMTLFRIGTGGAGGTYYPIGSLIAQALSNPPGSRPCDQGGSCGVANLIGVAQSSNGSVANLEGIAEGLIESGFAQSDVTYWAYSGTGIFEDKKRIDNLRAIANLYPESIHLVARRGSGIRSVADLAGKRVSLDEPGSGTLVDARIILDAYGLSESDIEPQYVKPLLAAERMLSGALDAFFIVAGYPVQSIAQLVETDGCELVPIAGPQAQALLRNHRFFSSDTIPPGTYGSLPAVATLSVNAQWITRAELGEELVYQITKTLWNETTARLLHGGHAKGLKITEENALAGVGVPLHPGAARYYREAGLLR
ncbi:MAG: TAXI family TRAP transporter solute-binding subunit [Kiloniellales bacterium]